MTKQIGRPRALANVADDVIIRALDDAAGIISDAARLLKMQGIKVSRQTLSRLITERPDLQDALKTIEAAKLDFAEAVLFNRVKAGDGPSTHFLLSMKGKERGYAKTAEIAVTTKPEPAPGFIDFINTLSQDELRVLYTLGMRAQGKKGVLDDELVKRGLVPPREVTYVPPDVRT